MKTLSYTNGREPILAARAADVAMRRFLDARVVGRRLAWSREVAGISQAELAEFVGMSRRTLARIESGERVLLGRERAAIARGLGVSIGFLTVGSNGNGKAVAR